MNRILSRINKHEKVNVFIGNENNNTIQKTNPDSIKYATCIC
jgi:hypothetical protein